MKRKLKLLVTLVLGITLMVGFNSCGKESSGGIEPTPVNPTPNNGGGGNDKPTPEPDDKPTPIGDGKVKVFEQVVNLSDGQVVSVECDTVSDHFSVTFNGKVPDDVKPGKVLFVRNGNETIVILVGKVDKTGNTAEIDGKLGDLTYVFYDTEFAITGDPSLLKGKDIPIYTPLSMNNRPLSKTTAKFSVDKKINGVKVKGGSEFGFDLIDESEGQTKRWGWNATVKPFVGFTVDDNWSLDASLKMGLTASFVYWSRYGVAETVNVCNLDFLKAQWIEQEFYLDGGFEFEPEVTGSFKVTGKLVDEKYIHMFQLCGTEVPSPIGPLYVAIDLFGDVTLEVHAKAAIDLKAKMGFKGQLGIREYRDETYQLINNLELTSGYDDDKSDGEGIRTSFTTQCGLEFKFALYPVVSCSWISKKFLGVALGVKPEMKCTVDMGNKASTDGTILYGTSSGTFSLSNKVCLGGVHEKILKNQLKFYPIPFSIKYDYDKGELSASTKEGDFLDIFPDVIKIKCPEALFVDNISDGTTKLEFTKADVNPDVMTDNIIDFPIKAGVPIKISFKPYSKLYWNLLVVKGERLIDFSFPPNHIFFKTKDPDFYDAVMGCYPEYEWTPASDDDYLEATIYDHECKKIKGYCKIRNQYSPIQLVVDISETTVSQNEVLYYVVSTSELCDFDVYVDNPRNKQSFEQTNMFTLNLPTDEVGEHTITIKAKGKGNRIVEKNLSYIVTEPIPPLTLSCKPITSVIYGEENKLIVDANRECTFTLFDGNSKVTSNFGESITYDLSKMDVGVHTIKVVATSDNETKQVEFTCTVTRPDTPVNPSAQLPSVSGTEINNGIPNSGYAPNVGGQNLESEYNSGGNAPSVKGQNIDQYYNGGGSTPEIKGTNL